MSAAELAAFLQEERTVICATNGQDGFPHLMPLWYVVRDGDGRAHVVHEAAGRGGQLPARYGATARNRFHVSGSRGKHSR